MTAISDSNRATKPRTDEHGRQYVIQVDANGNPITPGTAALDAGTKVTAVAALGAGGSGMIGWLSQIWAALGGVLRVEPLGQPSIAHQVTVTSGSENQALTTTCRRISIKARACDMRYAVGDSAQTANSTTSHFIEGGERLDIAVPLNGHIAVIRDAGATADGKLCITELI